MPQAHPLRSRDRALATIACAHLQQFDAHLDVKADWVGEYQYGAARSICSVTRPSCQRPRLESARACYDHRPATRRAAAMRLLRAAAAAAAHRRAFDCLPGLLRVAGGELLDPDRAAHQCRLRFHLDVDQRAARRESDPRRSRLRRVPGLFATRSPSKCLRAGRVLPRRLLRLRRRAPGSGPGEVERRRRANDPRARMAQRAGFDV